MPFYAIEGVTPVVDPSAYVHPTAVLIGDVIIGPDCYIGPCASLRGDFGRIVLQRGANVQDTCVVHGFPSADTVIEENGHIGHGAVLHSCLVRRAGGDERGGDGRGGDRRARYRSCQRIRARRHEGATTHPGCRDSRQGDS